MPRFENASAQTLIMPDGTHVPKGTSCELDAELCEKNAGLAGFIEAGWLVALPEPDSDADDDEGDGDNPGDGDGAASGDAPKATKPGKKSAAKS